MLHSNKKYFNEQQALLKIFSHLYRCFPIKYCYLSFKIFAIFSITHASNLHLNYLSLAWLDKSSYA